MLRYCFAGLVVALVAPSAVQAQEKVVLPKGPGPLFFVVTEVSKDRLVIDVGGATGAAAAPGFSTALEYKPPFRDLNAFDTKGKKLTADEVIKRLKPGSVVLVGVDGKRVDPAYLSIVKDDTVIMVILIAPAAVAPAVPPGEPEK